MVFVLDKHQKPLMPCTEKRARLLLNRKRAVVHKVFPFTIRIKDRVREKAIVEDMQIKIDGGAKYTGIAIITDSSDKPVLCPYLAEIHHKTDIKSKLDTKRAIRKSRRGRKTRYRKKRFLNRKRRAGWLPPSVMAVVQQTESVLNKLFKLLPVKSVVLENVKFDSQLMENAELRGIEYQQGTLSGYEVREYLLEKWGRTCAYCKRKDIPLEIEHIIPKSRGGSDRVSNLTLACKKCNQKKGNSTAEEFGYPHIGNEAKKCLKYTAFMNSTRWTLYNRLVERGYTVRCGTGGRTKKQRIERMLPKTHYFDALCVGNTPDTITIKTSFVEIWTSQGRGCRRIANIDRYGFPVGHKDRKKTHFGFITGDTVRASIPKGKYRGLWTGRVLLRRSGYFDIKDLSGQRIVQGVSWKHLKQLQRNNGWFYGKILIHPTTLVVSFPRSCP